MDERSNPEHGESEVELRSMAWTLAGVLILVMSSALIAWWMLGHPGANHAAGSHAPTEPSTGLPRLQRAPERDLADLRAREEQLLHSAEWIDPKAGVARIPIEAAMELLAKRAGQKAPPHAQGGAP
jgi:hypothetical protein